MAETSIEWTDHSISPVRARDKATGAIFHWCEKISSGCANCYAARMAQRFGLPDYVKANRDKVEFFLDMTKLHEVLKRKKPTRYFWEDCSDLMGDWVSDEWLDFCFATMALTPHHTHQILTKRPDRMLAYFMDAIENDPDGLLMRWGAAAGCLLDGTWIWHSENAKHRPVIERFISRSHGFEEDDETRAEKPLPWPLPNIWGMVSVENQDQAWRIEKLLQCPFAVRGISAEPLLGPVILHKYLAQCECGEGHGFTACPNTGGVAKTCSKSGCESLRPKIHWVIVGGESGPGARPCDVAWIRSIVEQCRAAGTACFVKQLGSNPINKDYVAEASAFFEKQWGFPPSLPNQIKECTFRLKDRKGGTMSEWPESLRVRQFPVA